MNQAPVAAPAAQAVAVKALNAALGVRVSTKKPKELGERYVIVGRIGGSSSSFATSDPRFLIQCYAPNELAAEQFAEEVVAVWRRLRSHGIVHAYDDHNLIPYADPDTSHARFQFTGGLKIGL